MDATLDAPAMPNTEPTPKGLPLVAYAENLCKGARVLLIAETALPLAEAILERGARLVHVFEKDPSRRAEGEVRASSREITFGPPADGLHESFFDLVLCENLANEADAVASMHRFARMLGPRGVALVATPNAEAPDPLAPGRTSQALDYYALHGAAAAAFPHVRMLGQVPFTGYAVIDFAAEGEPSPVFDTSLVPARGEEPGYFVAFAARQPRPLEGYVLVQVPSSGVLGEAPRAPAPLPSSAPSEEPARARVAELEKQLARQEKWITEIEARAATADERADAAEAELDALREQIGNREQERSHERASEIEARASAKSEIERWQRRVNELSDALEAKQSDLAIAQGELSRAQAERDGARTELDALRSKLAPLQAEVAALASDPTQQDEIARLEIQLKEQGQKVRGLERDLREAERIGRELVRKLSTERAGPAANAVAARLVEAEAELVSLRWSLSMLGRGRGASAITPEAAPQP